MVYSVFTDLITLTPEGVIAKVNEQMGLFNTTTKINPH